MKSLTDTSHSEAPVTGSYRQLYAIVRYQSKTYRFEENGVHPFPYLNKRQGAEEKKLVSLMNIDRKYGQSQNRDWDSML